MTETNQMQAENVRWDFTEELRSGMDEDDFRDSMLSFLFLRHLSEKSRIIDEEVLGV